MTESTALYHEVDGPKYTALQRELLRKTDPGPAKRRDFLEAARDSDGFLAFLDHKGICITTDNSAVTTTTHPLTEQSLRELPANHEKALYDSWSHIPAGVACQQAFWAHVTLQHIRDHKIRSPSWLALNGQLRQTGAVRIDRALKTADDKEIDSCTRTIFRRMAGLRSVRGVRSLFTDAPFARAWWRMHTIQRVAATRPDASKSELHKVLRSSREYWERLIEMVVCRSSVYGSLDVQGSLIIELAHYAHAHKDSRVLTSGTLTRLLRRVSGVAALIELDALDHGERGIVIRNAIDQVVQAAQDTDSTTSPDQPRDSSTTED